MRLVLDTDVLMAGLRSATGASRVLLQAVDAGIVVPLVSIATVLEYEAVLKRPAQMAAMRLRPAEVDAFLDGLIALADHIDPVLRSWPSIRDPDDELFVAVAVTGEADAIVTFNVGDYTPIDRRCVDVGVPVCRPGEMVRRLPWRASAISPSACLRH
jgi:putative PIN family toxin of toxin-antitoxin system